jgi:hypothetical protein
MFLDFISMLSDIKKEAVPNNLFFIMGSSQILIPNHVNLPVPVQGSGGRS